MFFIWNSFGIVSTGKKRSGASALFPPWEKVGMTETLNDCSWPPQCVNYCGQSAVGRRFQQWSWPILLLGPAGRYLLSIPWGNMRQYSASLIASSHINKHKINSWAKCKAEFADMIFMIAVVVVWRNHRPLYSRWGSLSFAPFLGEATLCFSSVQTIQPIRLPISLILQGEKFPRRWDESKTGSVLRVILS